MGAALRTDSVDRPIAEGTTIAYDVAVLRRVLSCLALAIALGACAGDPPPAQIPLARLTGVGCIAYEGQPIDRVCVPPAARENAPVTLELEERCGSCSTTVERCTVTVDGRDILLSLDGQSCNAPRDCADVCTKRRTVCRLPALGSGRYAIRYADGAGRVDLLEIAAGGVSTCALDDGA